MTKEDYEKLRPGMRVVNSGKKQKVRRVVAVEPGSAQLERVARTGGKMLRSSTRRTVYNRALVPYDLLMNNNHDHKRIRELALNLAAGHIYSADCVELATAVLALLGPEPVEPKRLLSDEDRAALVAHLVDERRGTMFGDGLEEDYILDGFPSDPGLNHMTDAELLVELGHHSVAQADQPELLAQLWRHELYAGTAEDDTGFCDDGECRACAACEALTGSGV